MKKNELTTLQSIAKTLSVQPSASQRTLAKNAGISVALMNSVLKRFAERGWIMLSNVNKRKLAYAVTPKGIGELAERGKKFVAKTFQIASAYNEAIFEEISCAKRNGKTKVVLYGNSCVKFLLEYACKENQIPLEVKPLTDNFSDKTAETVENQIAKIKETAFCVAGEINDEETLDKLLKAGCVNLLNMARTEAIYF